MALLTRATYSGNPIDESTCAHLPPLSPTVTAGATVSKPTLWLELNYPSPRIPENTIISLKLLNSWDWTLKLRIFNRWYSTSVGSRKAWPSCHSWYLSVYGRRQWGILVFQNPPAAIRMFLGHPHASRFSSTLLVSSHFNNCLVTNCLLHSTEGRDPSQICHVQLTKLGNMR